MSTKENNLKEKFKIALTSTAKVIADDLDVKKKNSEEKKIKEFNFLEIDNLTSPAGLVKLSISRKLNSFIFFSSEFFFFTSKSSAITFAVEVKAILNFSFKLFSLVLIRFEY